jgi:hypothetical protein
MYLAQHELNVCLADSVFALKHFLWWRRTVIILSAMISSNSLEEAIPTISQRLHAAIVRLISEASHPLKSDGSLIQNELPTEPPVSWVNGPLI